MYKLLTEMFPYNRSITGDGVRETLNRISKEIPIKETCIKSGTKVFDWTVPNEWNVNSAKIFNSKGDVIVDFADNNLFLMSYSSPINDTMSLQELKTHIITDSTRPDWVPYSTSYYEDKWAFCLPYNFVKEMVDDNYKVEIDATKIAGDLIYAEAFIDNGSNKEILISSYICHPSMANDSLSGVVLTVQLYKELKNSNLGYNYRFLFTPETIGTICFLFNNRDKIKSNLEYGLVATCVGDAGGFTYKKARNKEADINRIVDYIFSESNAKTKVVNFSPFGSDERQYCSPGFDLDVGVLTRSMYSCFPEYHTSADNLQFVSEENLTESLQMYLKIIYAYEINCKFYRRNPFCEPQMGKYNMYRTTGGGGEDTLNTEVQQRMWILNYADGKTDLLTIAKESGYSLEDLKRVLDSLIDIGLIIKESN